MAKKRIPESSENINEEVEIYGIPGQHNIMFSFQDNDNYDGASFCPSVKKLSTG